MKLKKCEVSNFCSYKHLVFDFEDMGLTLVQGATGSGKSTLQDMPVWVLFGVTAKNGSVDEVKSWTSNGALTVGILEVDVQGITVKITRVRGASKDNDLYWEEKGATYRGKDLVDTQKLLNKRLGVTNDLYCLATYYNEFSDVNSFFLNKAKDRRELFEKVANLDLPIVLAEKVALKKKQVKVDLEQIRHKHAMLQGKQDQLSETRTQVLTYIERWDKTQKETIEELKTRSKYFDKEKESKLDALSTKSYRFESDKHKKIDELIDKLDELDQRVKPSEHIDAEIEEEKRKMSLTNPTCPTCKRSISTNSVLDKLLKQKEVNQQHKDRFSDLSEKLKEIQKTKNPYKDLEEQVKKETNQYDDQIKLQSRKKNPFLAQLVETDHNLGDCASKLLALDKELLATKYKLDSLGQIYDLSFVLRGALLKEAIKTIQNKTNDYLSNYFDSEFRVNFELNNSDSLLVEITKNGNPCVYTQLSKGQRQLLRLCFSVSVMEAAANNSGVHFTAQFFDEPCDGLDEELKIKAFRLFEELSTKHSTVIVIDHTPSFQNMFNNKYLVELVGDESVIIHE